MLKRMVIDNFTVFGHAELEFGQLNVIHGENGTGKTHLLKLAYALWATEKPLTTSGAPDVPTKDYLDREVARKLKGVFRPDSLGRLARRVQGTTRCEIRARFRSSAQNINLSFHTTAQKQVDVTKVPQTWAKKSAIFLPTREALSIFPGFVALYESQDLGLDETWRDLCQALDTRRSAGQPTVAIQQRMAPLERAIGGKLAYDGKRFVLRVDGGGNFEIDLIAEGQRKIGTIAWLLANDKLPAGSGLFWDEPEANLNPKLIRVVAKAIVELAAAGVQVFIATHSLFLLRELELLSTSPSGRTFDWRHFGLFQGTNGVDVKQAALATDAGSPTALDESLGQSERYLAWED